MEVMLTCNKCGAELTLWEFERYKENEETYTYVCKAKGCTLEGVKIHRGLPTSTKTEVN